MKKLILTIGLVSVAISSVNAQGLVVFGNGSTSRISTNGVTSGLTSAAASGSFYYALFYSTTATTVGGSTSSVTGSSANGYVFNSANSSSWTAVTSIATNTSAGRFLSSTADANGATIINGLTGGSSANFVVVGWSANLGTTLSALENSLTSQNWSGIGYLGESVVSGSLTAGDGNLVPTPALFGPSSPAVQGFTLTGFTATPIPEPTTLALAGLSGASLLLFRRRK